MARMFPDIDVGSDLWCYRQKVKAAQKSRELLTHDFLILDTETTGLDESARITDIGVIDSDGNVLVSHRLNPQMQIEEKASEITGLTNAMLVGCPTFAEIASELFMVLKGELIVIYNAAFDTGVLNSEFERVGYNVPIRKTGWNNKPYYSWNSIFSQSIQEIPPVCAMLLYAQWWGDYSNYWGNFKWQKLVYACERFNIHVRGDAHSATGDCRRTLAVLDSMSLWLERHEQLL